MKKNTNTLCTTSARHSDTIQMANPPMYQGSTIIYERMVDLAAAHHAYESGQESYTYGRKGTPTSRMLCEALTELEGGHRTYLCPSGLAALSTALLSQLSAGDHVLMVDTVADWSPVTSSGGRTLFHWSVTVPDPVVPQVRVNPWVAVK